MTILPGALDPDRDEARQWLSEELAEAEYNRPESLVQRFAGWLLERLEDLITIVPGSTGLSTVLLVLVLAVVGVAVWFAVRGTRRSARLRTPTDGAVIEDPSLTAADYRARAVQAARAGDWDTVLLDSYRALAAGADERTLLDELPGRTAHEIAVALAPRFTDHSGRLADAADRFDAVRYGDQRATEEQARSVLDLDRELARTRPRLRVPA